MNDNDFKNIEDIQRILKYIDKGKLDLEASSRCISHRHNKSYD